MSRSTNGCESGTYGTVLILLHVEDPKVPLPLMEPIQRMMVRADVCRRDVTAHRSIEHPAQRPTINHAALHAKAHNPTRAVVHHDRGPSVSVGSPIRIETSRDSTDCFSPDRGP